MILLGLGVDPDTDVAGTVDWPIFVDVEPDSPDNVLVVSDTTWQGDGRTQPDGETLWHYGVQVKVRASGHPDGWAKARQVQATLDQQVAQNLVPIAAAVTGTAATYVVHSISKTGILVVGQAVATTKRHVFTLNPVIAITQLS